MTASEQLPVQLACRVLGVAESGFHEWRTRSPSVPTLRQTWLTDQVQSVRQVSFGTYGGSRPSRASGTASPSATAPWSC